MPQLYPNCSCDPISPTSDCHEDKCTPFFATFFSLQLILLLFLVAFFFLVEYKSEKRSWLWRIILGCGVIAELAKVIRTGLLINKDHRHTMDTFLYTLYNTHLCFGAFSFVSLLFFWARLQHDLVPSKKLFGKLMPAYVIIMLLFCIFFYLQIFFLSSYNDSMVANVCVYATGFVFLVLALSYIINGLFLWKTFLSTTDKQNLFFRMFLSAFVSSILIVIFNVFLLAFNVVDFNTTNDYLIKHSIYESLFILLFLAFPSGFVVHYFEMYIFKKTRVPSLPVEMKKKSITYSF